MSAANETSAKAPDRDVGILPFGRWSLGRRVPSGQVVADNNHLVTPILSIPRDEPIYVDRDGDTEGVVLVAQPVPESSPFTWYQEPVPLIFDGVDPMRVRIGMEGCSALDEDEMRAVGETVLTRVV
jgi:hypothetical protein